MKKNYAISIVLSSALLVLSGCGDSSSVKKSVLDNNTNIEVASNGDLAINLIDSKVNAAPVATFKTFSTSNGVVYNGLLTADDRDLDNVEFKLSIQPKHGRVTVNSNGTFVYTPEDGYVGKDNFSFSECSGSVVGYLSPCFPDPKQIISFPDSLFSGSFACNRAYLPLFSGSRFQSSLHSQRKFRHLVGPAIQWSQSSWSLGFVQRNTYCCPHHMGDAGRQPSFE